MNFKRMTLAAGLGLAAGLAAEPSVEEQLQALRADVETIKATHAHDSKAAGLQVWVQLTGVYNNRIAGGDDAAGLPVNRGTASSTVDFGFQGKPAEDLDALAVLRVNSLGSPAVWDVWVEQSLPGGLRLRGGFLDLTGIFDAAALANDDKSQFLRPEFVDNPALNPSPGAPGLRLFWQATEHAYVQAAVHDLSITGVDPVDNAYLIVETGCHHDWLGGEDLKAWYRESGRGLKGAVTAYGVVLDKDLSHGLKAYARWGQEFLATGLEHNAAGAYSPAPLNKGGASGQAPFVTANAGLQWTGPFAARPDDRLAASWGTVRACDTSDRDYAETYYAWILNSNVEFSLHYQIDYSRLLLAVPHDWNNDGIQDSTTYAAQDTEHRVMARVNLAY